MDGTSHATAGTSGTLHPTTIPAPHGKLEALLQEHDEPFAVALVCHPHPLFGGTMHNPVTYRTARQLHEAGANVVRFNFRGVGGSTGTYGNAVGEEDDVLAALDFIQKRYGSLPIWLAGYSFGARVGLAVGARDPRVGKLLGVGLAIEMFDMRFLRDCPKPKAIIQGELDEYGNARAAEALLEGARPPTRLAVVDGARHFFEGRFNALEVRVREAIDFLRDAR